ncbi:MAG: hypothetical protein IPK17_00420 [Chloroflexi bacterium]|uniref:hypothetical protein n=1 Tax=Candidatus Flexifilum breve TaxID=3140694 RepID=UPI0031348580|nr:hypothetical protein [Chloroflexota bacterium]
MRYSADMARGRDTARVRQPESGSRRASVRATKRIASSLHADWIAVYVETPRPLKPADRLRITETLRLADQLGAQTVTLHGAQIGDEVLHYAREHNISRVIVGKPTHPAGATCCSARCSTI